MGLPDSTVAERLVVPAGADQRAVASYPRGEDCTGSGPMNATAGNGGRGAAAAHAVDLAKTYGVGQASVRALDGISVTFERAGSPPSWALRARGSRR